MKRFKEKGFCVFYIALVLTGAFVIVAFGLQNQFIGVPSLNAQGNYYGSDPAPYSTHPGSYIFQSAFPGDIILDDSGMRTIMTCSGCNITISTCDWQCGPTFSNCPSVNRSGQGSILGLFGKTYTSGICVGTDYPTLNTCSIGCSGGRTIITCSSSLFGSCGGSTMSTCPPICIDSGQTYGSALSCGGGVINTLMTCSSLLFGGCDGGENLYKKMSGYHTSIGCTSYGPYMGCIDYPIGGSSSFFTQSPAM